eukprot:TRINITY_DN1558_c0_g2_i3.p1 TRINITY_DN1558_c0_g2~~TRINITY_DN1558_c0_g2_i3.p1  ORF type:complete len:284 (-),score=57.27 TRINITY_DN1558_c0_g2_i3:35-886(-)
MLRHARSLSKRLSRGTSSQPRATSIPGMPGPPIVPGMGTLPHFLEGGGPSEPTKWINSVYKEHGKVFSLDLSGQDEWVVLTDPHDFASVIAAEGEYPQGTAGQLPLNVKFYAEHPEYEQTGLSLNGPEWQKARHAIQPAIFSLPVANSFYPLLDAPSERCSVNLPKIFEGEYDPADFNEYFNRVALDLFTNIMLGIDKGFSNEKVDQATGEHIKNAALSINLITASVQRPDLLDEHYAKFEPAWKDALYFMGTMVDEVCLLAWCSRSLPASLLLRLIRVPAAG